MIQTILPNARWLTLPSLHEGRDWAELAQKIDEELPALGMELAEESIFLLFERGECLVARPVTGPKKNLPGPIKLRDWTQSPVLKKVLQSYRWEDILAEVRSSWTALGRPGPPEKFMLLIKRRLIPDLKLTVELLIGE